MATSEVILRPAPRDVRAATTPTGAAGRRAAAFTAALARQHGRTLSAAPALPLPLTHQPHQPAPGAAGAVHHHHAAPQLRLALTLLAQRTLLERTTALVAVRAAPVVAHALRLITVVGTGGAPPARPAVPPAPLTVAHTGPVPPAERPLRRVPPVELLLRRGGGPPAEGRPQVAPAVGSPPPAPGREALRPERPQRRPAPELDLGQLADQVLRQIDRRAVARRERMGRG